MATHLELSQLLLQRSVLGLHRLQLRLQVLHLVRIGGIQVLLDEAVPAQRPALAAPSAAGGGGRGALQGIRRLLAGLVQRHQHCAAAPHPRQQRNTRDSAASTAAAGERRRTLRQGIDHARPLEVLPELLLLRLGVLDPQHAPLRGWASGRVPRGLREARRGRCDGSGDRSSKRSARDLKQACDSSCGAWRWVAPCSWTSAPRPASRLWCSHAKQAQPAAATTAAVLACS